MAKLKKFLSVFGLFIMLFSLSTPICSVSAELPEELEEDDVQFNEEYLHSLSYLTRYENFNKEDLRHENIDNVDYICIVNNGEASILNVHTRFKGPEKVVLTLPTCLGGYPVTTFGYVGKKIEVFWFIKYDEVFESRPDYGGEYEYDPGLNYVSKIIFPEGYEYIGDLSMRNYAKENFSWQLPKSLKKIYGEPVEYFLLTLKQNL